MSFGALSSMQMGSSTPRMPSGAQGLDRGGNQYRSAGGQMGATGMGASSAGGGGGFSMSGMMSVGGGGIGVSGKMK